LEKAFQAETELKEVRGLSLTHESDKSKLLRRVKDIVLNHRFKHGRKGVFKMQGKTVYEYNTEASEDFNRGLEDGWEELQAQGQDSWSAGEGAWRQLLEVWLRKINGMHMEELGVTAAGPPRL
jgi:hypothetical protein